MAERRPPAARQLPLSLPHRAAMTRADFLVGAGNAQAAALVDAWPAWPSPVVLLAGPVGSGKTHVVEMWREASGAAAVAAQNLTDADVMPLVGAGAVAVEDLHAGRFDEPALFHLLNLAAERKVPVLLTSRLWASALPVRLPDLASRLRAARPVELGEPDDDLLRRVLVKLFADRQLAVDPPVVDYIVTRMERSLEAASAVVDAIDHDALAAAAPITRRVAASAIARVFDGAQEEDEGQGGRA
jgi:chromosomal replication initiation ATPase DnaA